MDVNCDRRFCLYPQSLPRLVLASAVRLRVRSPAIVSIFRLKSLYPLYFGAYSLRFRVYYVGSRNALLSHALAGGSTAKKRFGPSVFL